MIDGVAPSAITLPSGNWPTLIDFLDDWFPSVSRQQWLSRFERNLVTRDDGQPIAPGDRYRQGMRLLYYREVDEEMEIPFEASIVYRDEHLLIADKPHFLPVIPSGRYVKHTLLRRLKRDPALAQLAPLHRIDRATAGLVAFSVNPDSRAMYQQLFPRREVRKLYHAVAPAIATLRLALTYKSRLVKGTPFFRMCESEHGPPNSETHVRQLERAGDWSLYELEPVTGRTHQLRVHMSALGAPIRNDSFYPELRPFGEADDYSKPLQLLAHSLTFKDPISNVQKAFQSNQSLNLPCTQ